MNDMKTNKEDLQTMWKVSKKIRKELMQQSWKFEGDIKNFAPPTILSTFLKWIIAGPPWKEYGTYKNIECLIATTITQLVSQSV
jgi:SRSO17 transposase